MRKVDQILRGIAFLCFVAAFVAGGVALYQGEFLMAGAAYLIAYVGYDISKG